MEYSAERMDDLMRAYDEYISSCAMVRMPEVYCAIVNMAAKRFYVSQTRAEKVLRDMMSGADISGMRPVKREMFMEIKRRVEELMARKPKLSLGECCAIVVEQPAPKFYLSPGSAKIMVCKARKKWIRRKMERLRLLRRSLS